MSIQYQIKAQVIDIAKDTPRDEDQFLLDTNVLYWWAYSRDRDASANQKRPYLKYLGDALGEANLQYAAFSLIELAHLIEQSEFKIYSRSQSLTLTLKEYRHNFPDERVKVKGEIQAAWNLLESLVDEVLDTVIDGDMRQNLSALPIWTVDIYDQVIYQTMLAYDINQIVTDDGDFATLPQIQVFTANPSVISQARDQKRLIRRR